MFCDNCKIRNASFIYKETINGENIQYNLCSECAKKINKNLMFFDMFKDFFVDFDNINFDNSKTEIKCEKCGNTLENIKNKGKMGCENCYNLFEQNILPILKNIQFDNKHIGKNIENKDLIFKNNLDELDELKKRLKKAIEIEDYELAIILRDKIRKIEKGDNL